MLEARLRRDRIARGVEVKVTDGEADPKKAKRKVKDVGAVQLIDAVASEYEEILARVCQSYLPLDSTILVMTDVQPRLTIIMATNSLNL